MFGKDVVVAVENKLKEINMSKGEFYKKSGISSATFSQWRTGMYEPSTDNLARIESCLGLSFEISEKEKQHAENGKLSDRLEKIMEYAERLTEEQQDFLITQLSAFQHNQ